MVNKVIPFVRAFQYVALQFLPMIECLHYYQNVYKRLFTDS